MLISLRPVASDADSYGHGQGQKNRANGVLYKNNARHAFENFLATIAKFDHDHDIVRCGSEEHNHQNEVKCTRDFWRNAQNIVFEDPYSTDTNDGHYHHFTKNNTEYSLTRE